LAWCHPRAEDVIIEIGAHIGGFPRQSERGSDNAAGLSHGTGPSGRVQSNSSHIICGRWIYRLDSSTV
jgi:hypothetical protein